MEYENLVKIILGRTRKKFAGGSTYKNWRNYKKVTKCSSEQLYRVPHFNRPVLSPRLERTGRNIILIIN